MCVFPCKVSRSFPHKGRVRSFQKMNAFLHIKMIRRETGTDHFRMDFLKENAGFAVLLCKIKVSAGKAEGPKMFFFQLVRAKQLGRRKDRIVLCSILFHDLDPADETSGRLAEQDMGAVCLRGLRQRRGKRRIRRDDDALGSPVVQVAAGIAPHTVPPDPVFAVGQFLVFTVPVKNIVYRDDAAAVCLNGVSLRIQPGSGIVKFRIHRFRSLFCGTVRSKGSLPWYWAVS